MVFLDVLHYRFYLLVSNLCMLSIQMKYIEVIEQAEERNTHSIVFVAFVRKSFSFLFGANTVLIALVKDMPQVRR